MSSRAVQLRSGAARAAALRALSLLYLCLALLFGLLQLCLPFLLGLYRLNCLQSPRYARISVCHRLRIIFDRPPPPFILRIEKTLK